MEPAVTVREARGRGDYDACVALQREVALELVVVDDACAFFGSQNIVSPSANKGMVNEEMLVRATGPVVRHLHAVLLGDRYLETDDLPPESDNLDPQPPVTATNDGSPPCVAMFARIHASARLQSTR